MFKIVYTSLSFSKSRCFTTGVELQPNWSAGFWSVTSLPWNSRHHSLGLMENLGFQEVNTSTVHLPTFPSFLGGSCLKGVGAAKPKCLKTHPMERKVLVFIRNSLSMFIGYGGLLNSATRFFNSSASAVDILSCLATKRLFTTNAISGQQHHYLVVSAQLKNISQNGKLPQIGVKIKNIWKHHLDQNVGIITSQ